MEKVQLGRTGLMVTKTSFGALPIQRAAMDDAVAILRRSPTKRFLGPEGEEIMSKVEDCIHCNHCKDNCPYQLDTPALLVENLRDYRSFRAGANA